MDLGKALEQNKLQHTTKMEAKQTANQRYVEQQHKKYLSRIVNAIINKTQNLQLVNGNTAIFTIWQHVPYTPDNVTCNQHLAAYNICVSKIHSYKYCSVSTPCICLSDEKPVFSDEEFDSYDCTYCSCCPCFYLPIWLMNMIFGKPHRYIVTLDAIR